MCAPQIGKIKTNEQSSFKCLIKYNKLLREMRFTLSINHGITCTAKDSFTHWELLHYGLQTKKRSKGQLLLFIHVSYFYFPSFLTMCLIFRDKFKSVMNYSLYELTVIPKARGCLFVALSHPQTAWHTYVFSQNVPLCWALWISNHTWKFTSGSIGSFRLSWSSTKVILLFFYLF